MRTEAALPGTEITRAVESLLRAEPARMAKLLDALRAPGRYVESTVQGMSMGRGLPSGSRIRIELVTPECFAVGTVIAFLAGEISSCTACCTTDRWAWPQTSSSRGATCRSYQIGRWHIPGYWDRSLVFGAMVNGKPPPLSRADLRLPGSYRQYWYWRHSACCD